MQQTRRIKEGLVSSQGDPLLVSLHHRPTRISAPAYCFNPRRNPWYSTAPPYLYNPWLCSPVQNISVNRICQGGYPSSLRDGPKINRRSGSDLKLSTPKSKSFCNGFDMSLTLALTISCVISVDESWPFVDIWAKLLVTLTSDSRPSVEDKRKSLSDLSFVDAVPSTG